MKADYIIRAGEPLSLNLMVLEGDIDEVVSASAVLKKAGTNMSVPPVSAPVIATFAVSSVEAPDMGWNFYIEDEITLGLAPGFYITNAKLNLVSGGPLKTDPITIEIRGTVTP
jgi:hypothetical protein